MSSQQHCPHCGEHSLRRHDLDSAGVILAITQRTGVVALRDLESFVQAREIEAVAAGLVDDGSRLISGVKFFHVGVPGIILCSFDCTNFL